MIAGNEEEQKDYIINGSKNNSSSACCPDCAIPKQYGGRPTTMKWHSVALKGNIQQIDEKTLLCHIGGFVTIRR